jgi:mono/diheme cytochrome c family protein
MLRITLLLLALFALVGCRRESTSAAGSGSAARKSAPALAPAAGAKLYAQHCAACHMPDGSGVPNMQPALDTSTVVAGDPQLLIRVVLKGPAAVLPAERDKYVNQMLAFGPILKDAEIAAILTHIRKEFANGASAIEPAQVAELRK